MINETIRAVRVAKSAVFAALIAAMIVDPSQVAVTPAHRMGEQWWKDRHAACVAMTQKGGIDVVFLGDSITQGWESTGKDHWAKNFATMKAGNFGFSGDRTEHVLWRLENGEMTGLDSRLVVMMIGTNNVGHGSSNAEQTALGVRAIVAKLKTSLPKAKVLLLGIFPRGEAANDPMRLAVAQATDGFKGVADGKQVRFLDIGEHFTHSSGMLRTLLMPDKLHLSPDGYGIWAKSILPDMHEMLSE